MQLSIRDVVLPARPAPVMGGARTWLGIGGKDARFMEAQIKIDEVTDFAQELWERHVRDDEMPAEVIHVSRVNYLVGQVLNGGFLQFVQNSGWNKSFVGGVRAGLAAIDAAGHLAVFEGGARLIDDAYANGGGKLDYDTLAATLDRLERKHLSNPRLSLRLRRIVNQGWTWGDRWQCLQLLSARYIDGWPGVRRVPAADLPAALDRIAAGVPDLAARRLAREDARPWEKKAIDRLVADAGLDTVWYTGFSVREHDGRKLWCWNFTTGKVPGQGHHQAVFGGGEAIMFKGRTDEIVARAAVPEAAAGSGVTRNEPSGEPGAEGSNIMFLISNP